MRVVRRASLILSLTLIVAIAVGYFARTSELGRARDLRLTSAAEVAASELASLVDTVSVAAATGRNPSEVSAALAEVVPDHGICVVSAFTTSCSGSGTLPGDEIVLAHERERRDGDGVDHHGRVTVSFDRQVTIDADGPAVSVIVAPPVRRGATTWPTTYLPGDATGSSYFDDGNTRQTAVAVPGATGVYVVATAERVVSLPIGEHRFYLIVFSLAVVLLLLAGITLLMEQRSLVERASFDPLTRLPNRSEFERRAEQVLAERDAGACLLLFDLDGFKAVNDTYGHHAGDELLQVIAGRLRRSVRDQDVVARWGGDEFVVLLAGVETAEMGARRARQLAEEVAGRTRVDRVPDALRVRASVGVALWPDHGDGLGDLIEAADRAMYEAKRSGSTSHVAAAPARTDVEPVVAG